MGHVRGFILRNQLAQNHKRQEEQCVENKMSIVLEETLVLINLQVNTINLDFDGCTYFSNLIN